MNQLWPDPITRLVERQTEELEREATQLRANKVQIDSRLEQIDGELGELQIAVKVYRRFAPSESTPAEPTEARSQVIEPPLVGNNGHRPELDGLTLAQAAEQVLRWLGGRAASGELRQNLIDAGVLKGDHSAYGYLLKTMRNKPDLFVKVQRGTWALAGEGHE